MYLEAEVFRVKGFNQNPPSSFEAIVLAESLGTVSLSEAFVGVDVTSIEKIHSGSILIEGDSEKFLIDTFAEKPRSSESLESSESSETPKSEGDR